MGQSILGSDKDSYVEPSNPTFKFGAFADIDVGENLGIQFPKGLISFDVSGLPATITQAILRLTANQVGGAGNTHWMYKLLHNDWVEADVTFEEKSSGVTWASGDFSSSDYTVTDGVSAVVPGSSLDTVDWDITVLVQDAIDSAIKVNLAIIQEALETGFGSWFSKEIATSSLRPKLIVDFPSGISLGQVID